MSSVVKNIVPAWISKLFQYFAVGALLSRSGKWEGTPCAGLLFLHNKDSSNKGTKLKVERKRNCEKPATFTEESAGKGGRRGVSFLGN